MSYIYRTTNTVKCDWCGAKPGEDCHLQRGQFAGFGENKKFHTCRIDPTSEPIGIAVEREGDPFIYMEPLPNV